VSLPKPTNAAPALAQQPITGTELPDLDFIRK
jgi:hypothetical protein